MPFDKDKKTYTGNCNYDEESKVERGRERERWWNGRESIIHVALSFM